MEKIVSHLPRNHMWMCVVNGREDIKFRRGFDFAWHDFFKAPCSPQPLSTAARSARSPWSAHRLLTLCSRPVGTR